MNFPAPGEIFAGKYRIESLLGKGGFSRVYRALQIDLEREVALKILRPPIQTDTTEIERQKKLDSMAMRFNREAKMMSKLRSPHTITMYDYGRTEDGLLFMVLEYINGMDLTHLIRAQGAIDPERVFKILRQVLVSLHEAHSLGMLHRDIKPQNIMIFEHLGQRDQIKLLDFGIVKLIDEESKADTRDLTDDGTLVGTPRYMSPEYIRGARIGPPSDLYSLGLVVYELLAGEQAITAESSIQIIGKQLEPQSFFLPTSLDVSPEFRRIINKMLHKDPTQRFQSAEDALAQMQDMEDRHLRAGSLPELHIASPEEAAPNVFGAQPLPAHLAASSSPMIAALHHAHDVTGPLNAPHAYPAPAQAQAYPQEDRFEDLDEPTPASAKKPPVLLAGVGLLAIFVFGGLGLMALTKDRPQTSTSPDAALAPLEAAKPRLYTIQTQPSGAIITLNGVSMGKSPLTLAENLFELPATVTATLGDQVVTRQLTVAQDLSLELPAPTQTAQRDASPPSPVPTEQPDDQDPKAPEPTEHETDDQGASQPVKEPKGPKVKVVKKGGPSTPTVKTDPSPVKTPGVKTEVERPKDTSSSIRNVNIDDI